MTDLQSVEFLGREGPDRFWIGGYGRRVDLTYNCGIFWRDGHFISRIVASTMRSVGLSA